MLTNYTERQSLQVLIFDINKERMMNCLIFLPNENPFMALGV
jgi:hypothetical protein